MGRPERGGAWEAHNWKAGSSCVFGVLHRLWKLQNSGDTAVPCEEAGTSRGHECF